jgi:hypothetical protein
MSLSMRLRAAAGCERFRRATWQQHVAAAPCKSDKGLIVALPCLIFRA